MKRNGAPFLWNGCAVLAEYAKKISLSKKAPYIYMKKWFKTQYPDYKVSVAEISENKEMEGSAA